ncbi:hypothetical protein ILUMI_07189, partial [Ignelater luminosus]
KHVRLHTSEKPFKCVTCSFECSDKSGLQKQVRIHTDRKPFKCEVYDKSFSRKQTVTAHVAVHNGETAFKCKICNSYFISNNSLQRHFKNILNLEDGGSLTDVLTIHTPIRPISPLRLHLSQHYINTGRRS